MNASAPTASHSELSRRPTTRASSNRQECLTQDNPYQYGLPPGWDFEQLQALMQATDPESSTGLQVSSSSLPIYNEQTSNPPPPQWVPAPPIIVHDQQRRTSQPDVTRTGQTSEGEVTQALFDWFCSYPADEQAAPRPDGQSSHTTAASGVDSPIDPPVVKQPDLVHGSASSVSTNSSLHSLGPPSGFSIRPPPPSRSLQAISQLDETSGSSLAGSSGQPKWNAQLLSNTSEGEEPSIAVKSWVPDLIASSERFTERPSSQSVSGPHAQKDRTQPPRTQQPQAQLDGRYRVAQPDASTRPATHTAPQYVNRPSFEQEIESPMISPLTIPPGDTFQARQAEAMGRINVGPQARPTLPRTRRRSAVYYRHGRTVADSSIEVFKDVAVSPAPDVGSRNRTISCDSSLQTRQRLGDVTNRSHTVSGPISRTRMRKESGSTVNAANDLDIVEELPGGMSNLAWTNNTFESYGADGAEHLSMLDKFREGLETEVVPRSTSQSR